MQGERLGPYLIERELGSGGMGKVYSATVADRAPGFEIGAVVALKVVHPNLLGTPGFFKRFMREAALGQSIEHENVVRTLDCDAIGGSHFLVMEYVEGQTLGALKVELDRVPEELCRHVAREICKGLSAIHGAGFVHRDLKPENVLITEDHIVKVMDLGIARLTDEAIRLSMSGAFVGSVEYAAPEQFKGGDVDGRCDLHALGLLLYELSTGLHPYRGDNFVIVMKHVLEDEPRRLGDVNPQLSAFFEEVVHTLLAKSPDERFATADELLAVLEEGEDSAWWSARAREIQATTKRPIRRIRIPRETAVYGREKEIAKLRALYEQAKSGDGQVVLLEGEAGIGKSRLVDELLVQLRVDNEDLNFLFGSYPPGGAATASGAFSSAFHEHFGEEGAAPYLSQTPLLVTAFDAVLRGDVAPDDAQPLTKDSLGTCFVRATRNLAAERPTIVLIDDLHFAPDEARALFSTLSMAVPGHRVLLIGTARPGVSQEWVSGQTRLPQTTQIDVPRLGPKDLIALLRDSFQSDALASSLGAQIAVKSDGNPFFAFEIIRGLREGQFITQKPDGTWVSTQIIEDIQIPSLILDLVNARVADLDDKERNLLDVAACWGYEFDPSLVGAVLGMSRIPTLQAFANVEKRHRLARSVGRNYVFDHHQVQEALYGELNEQLREEYHAALAEALEARTNAVEADPETLDGALCVDLCEHFLKGARGDAALRYLEPAQSRLTTRYLHAEMADLTERALAVPDLLIGVERANALLRLTSALDLLSRRTRQEEAAREAEQLADEAQDHELRAAAVRTLGKIFWRTSRQAEAEAAHRRALEIAIACGDRSGEAGAMVNLGVVFRFLDRLPEAREHCERGLAVCREIGNQKFEAVATGNLGVIFRELGRLPEARACQERHLALSREIGDRPGEAMAAGNLGLLFQSSGSLPEALEQCERHLALCREFGDRRGEAMATGNVGTVFHAWGRLLEAREHYERYLALSQEVTHPEGEAIAQNSLGFLHRDEENTEESEKCFLASLVLCEANGFRRLASTTHFQLGSMRLAASGGESGREQLIAAQHLAREVEHAGVETLTRCELALLSGGDDDDYGDDGDDQGALAAFSENEECLLPEERREARYLLWRATGDRAHLEEAKRLLDESLAKVPVEYHEAMRRNLRVHREIMAAWNGDNDQKESTASETVGDSW